MTSLRIVALSIATAVAYGILHDQVTARVCVEYFTIGHPPVFPTESPTLLALGWGILATWWCGLIVGASLAIVARAGTRPKLSARDLGKPAAWLLAMMGAASIAAGCAGYLAARYHWVWLVEPLATLVPEPMHLRYLADLWAHLAAYAIGVLGSIGIGFWIRRERRRRSVATPEG